MRTAMLVRPPVGVVEAGSEYDVFGCRRCCSSCRFSGRDHRDMEVWLQLEDNELSKYCNGVTQSVRSVICCTSRLRRCSNEVSR